MHLGHIVVNDFAKNVKFLHSMFFFAMKQKQVMLWAQVILWVQEKYNNLKLAHFSSIFLEKSSPLPYLKLAGEFHICGHGLKQK